jgi:hypothetical protein
LLDLDYRLADYYVSQGCPKSAGRAADDGDFILQESSIFEQHGNGLQLGIFRYFVPARVPPWRRTAPES